MRLVIFIAGILWLLGSCARFDAEGGSAGFLLLGGGGGAATATVDEDATSDDWDADGWTFRRSLSIDGSTLSGTLTGVPVLVLLDATRVDYTATQASGADLRFYDASGASLAHEIETFTPGGTSAIWIKVPEVVAGTTTVRMYYGNDSAADGQSPASVWSENYTMVLHLAETAGDGGTRSDSAGVAAAGTFFDADGDSDPTIAGRIGQADEFSGNADDRIDMGDQAVLNLTVFTLSGWFRTSGLSPVTILSRNLSITDRTYWVGLFQGQGNPMGGAPPYNVGCYGQAPLVFRTSSGGVTDVDIGVCGSQDDGAWHYFSATLDASGNAALYMDGAAAVTQAGALTPDQPAASVVVGHDNFTAGARYFPGVLDEIRVASVARSADWIDFQYLSQSDAAITFGAEESR